MPAEFALSTGAIQVMYDQDNDHPLAHEPVLQVLSIKKVNPANTGVDRYRLIISDGVHFAQAMLATGLNHLLMSDPAPVEKNTIVKLTQYACNVVQNRRIIICLGMEPVASAEAKIGTPVSVDTAGGGAAAAASSETTKKEATSPPPPPAAAVAASGRPGSNAGSTFAAKRNNVSGRSGAMGKVNAPPIYPIEGLSPYQNKWTIKARVSQKSDIRHYSNQRGDGKLFSVNLLDDTGEIKATGFNDAVDNLYPLLEEGKVYYISKARVQIAKKQFSTVANEYEISFENGTEVTLCEDQDSAPQVKYDLVELSQLLEIEKDQTCDVLGIVTDHGQLSEITTKATQKQIKKRDLTIVDRSGYSCRVTLWGRTAETWTENENGVYAFKGAKVGDFQGKNLSIGGQSTITADPDIPEAHTLRGWFDTEGQTARFEPFTSVLGGAGAGGMSLNAPKKDLKTLEQVKEEELGMRDQFDYFTCRATVFHISEQTMWYPACPSDGCNKKVTMEGDDSWRCEKCDRSYPAPEYRYFLNVCVNDHTSQIWLTGFNDFGLALFNRPASELEALKADDESAFSHAVSKARGTTFIFECRAKAESYNDVTKVKYGVQRVHAMNWVDQANMLLEQMKLWN